MPDIFAAVRERVSARSAAEFYGYPPNQSGFICCPLHGEKTPSMKFYDDGHFHCFGCHAGGSSIDFTARLFNLTPMEAVRQLDRDFSLHLPLDRPATEPERQRAAQEARRRQELAETHRRFDRWRRETSNRLSEVFRMAHFALLGIETPADLDALTDSEVEAIYWQPWAEYTSDVLTSGTMPEIMEIFRQRHEVTEICDRILNSTPTSSGAD